jgi:type I restriction-modification system DNA methylase subunit
MARRITEFQTIRSEGGLLPPDLLRRVFEPKEKLDGTRPEDYGLPQGERLNEVITQSWNRLRKHWTEFRSAAANLPAGEAGTGLTNDKWSLPLLRELGFGLLPTSAGPEINGRTYAIRRFFGRMPIHLVGCGLSLDHRAAGVRGAATANPHGLVQEFLNRSSGHLWAIVSNGLRLRVLRDNQALSRQSFLEFDLEAMFAGEVYSDFVLLWLIAHATRFASQEGNRTDTCWLEQWTKIANEQGTRALGDLKGGVERALQILGEGFTSHPKNSALRDALRTGQLPLADFHGELLRVVYRLIFLFVAEDRTIDGQSLLHPRDNSHAAQVARERYAAHYSTARLRDLAALIKGSRHGDLWRQFQVVTVALSGNASFAATRQQLALPALGSFLWDAASTTELNDAELTNHDFLEALRDLAFTRQGKVLRPVDYKNLGAEELGGVYESLLALTPQISADGARFNFAEFAGNERKTSGSYYTPDSLVQCLLDSALNPVVEEAIKGKTGVDAETAILALRVCDPAVGSGHFLVGAAHRLARHLSRVRATAQGESEPSPTLYQHALRDVIGRCLYGVDMNPMAAELCRVGLWLEALEPGKPLSFLDHHIRVGNSLLGTTPELIAGGIPDEAFVAIEGDDKRACAVLKKRNKAQCSRPTGSLFAEQYAESQARLEQAAKELEELPDDRPEAIRVKELAFRRHEQAEEYQHKKQLADTWCAAFVIRKRFSEPGRESSASGITQGHLNGLADGDPLPVEIAMEVEHLSAQYLFFHWHLAFPEVFAKGGFDCVLGNPPWVRQELFKSWKPLLCSYSSYRSTADLSVFFLELCVRILRPSRRAAMLTPNKWFRAAYGDSLRQFLRAAARTHLVVDFGHSKNLFPDADTFPACIVLSRETTRVPDEITLSFVRAHDEDRLRLPLVALLTNESTLVAHGRLTDSGWTFDSSEVDAVLSSIRNKGQPLSKHIGNDPLYGLKTGFNDAFYLEDLVAQSVIMEEPQSKELIRPFIRGRDIKRWNVVWARQWHIVIPSSHNRAWPWASADDDQGAEAIFSSLHPVLHARLKQFELALRSRTDQGRFWWELRSCDYYHRFQQPKIAMSLAAFHSACCLDEVGYFLNNSTVFIPSDDLFVLAVLNSPVAWWYMSLTFPHLKDEALYMHADHLARFPIPHAADSLKETIRERCRTLRQLLVDPTAALDPRVELERELSNLVVEAYGLTTGEQKVMDQAPVLRDPLHVLLNQKGAIELQGAHRRTNVQVAAAGEGGRS